MLEMCCGTYFSSITTGFILNCLYDVGASFSRILGTTARSRTLQPLNKNNKERILEQEERVNK
jgi:hypothetical protein